MLDITSYYDSICYVYPLSGKAVKHIAFENLPQGMKETVRDWGIAFPTRVFRTQWKGETVYHLLSALQNEDFGVYHESGENCRLYLDPEQYVAFIEEQKGTECVLILKGEIIKDSSGAKNELVGLWCHDWQHLTYSTINDHGTDVVQLYPNLPFSMTEVCQFEENGKGRLMTEKTYNDGRKEVCVDHFKYEVTDYTSPNYLSAILKKNAGLPLTAWDQFRLNAMQEYPVVTANFILDKDGKLVGKDSLKDYELVQYMRMFDR